jgi:hypothetical protein
MMLFDGRARPSLRAVLGSALSDSSVASFALRRVRLARVDLAPDELRGVARCRVLLGRLDADALADTGPAPSSARTAALLDMAASGRLEVRSASLLTWDPDFALVGHGTEDDLLVFGSIQFVPPLPERPIEELGLACALRDPKMARAAAARFEELWERAHDALEAVTDALCRSRSVEDA